MGDGGWGMGDEGMRDEGCEGGWGMRRVCVAF